MPKKKSVPALQLCAECGRETGPAQVRIGSEVMCLPCSMRLLRPKNFRSTVQAVQRAEQSRVLPFRCTVCMDAVARIKVHGGVEMCVDCWHKLWDIAYAEGDADSFEDGLKVVVSRTITQMKRRRIDRIKAFAAFEKDGRLVDKYTSKAADHANVLKPRPRKFRG